MCVAKPGADREDTPTLAIGHSGNFTQALHDSIVVNDHPRLDARDLGNLICERLAEMEIICISVTRQVLRSSFNATVARHEARDADADQRRELDRALL